MSQRMREPRWELWIVVLLLIALAGATGRAVGALVVNDVSDAKAAFDQAMTQPLGERIPLLEDLERQIGELLFTGVADPKQEIAAYKLQYLVQLNLAKYPEAHETFGGYARALKAWGEVGRARTSIFEAVREAFLATETSECAAIAEAALAHWRDDTQVAPGLLYYKARALTDLPGRTGEAVPVLEQIISEHLDSEWRPAAMRWLGHLQANDWGGDYQAALNTLSLLEQQYAGTWWEQYAHMKPAVLFEEREGDPQKALKRYQETLAKFGDHKYATFCRRQVERLQGVIEQQLIQDALEGLGKKENQPLPGHKRNALGQIDPTERGARGTTTKPTQSQGTGA